MTHADVWMEETRLDAEVESWLTWIDKVQELLGKSPDGDQDEDGYSLDGFYQLYQRNRSPKQAVKEIWKVKF